MARNDNSEISDILIYRKFITFSIICNIKHLYFYKIITTHRSKALRDKRRNLIGFVKNRKKYWQYNVRDRKSK